MKKILKIRIFSLLEFYGKLGEFKKYWEIGRQRIQLGGLECLFMEVSILSIHILYGCWSLSIWEMGLLPNAILIGHCTNI